MCQRQLQRAILLKIGNRPTHWTKDLGHFWLSYYADNVFFRLLAWRYSTPQTSFGIRQSNSLGINLVQGMGLLPIFSSIALCYLRFLSPPMQLAWWSHFLSVHSSGLENNSLENKSHLRKHYKQKYETLRKYWLHSLDNKSYFGKHVTKLQWWKGKWLLQ